MSESQQGPVPMEGGERASADNGAGVASKAKTAGALTGAAAGAVGLGAVTGERRYCQQWPCTAAAVAQSGTPPARR